MSAAAAGQGRQDAPRRTVAEALRARYTPLMRWGEMVEMLEAVGVTRSGARKLMEDGGLCTPAPVAGRRYYSREKAIEQLRLDEVLS